VLAGAAFARANVRCERSRCRHWTRIWFVELAAGIADSFAAAVVVLDVATERLAFALCQTAAGGRAAVRWAAVAGPEAEELAVACAVVMEAAAA